MKRKIISWLLAIACCISLLPSNLVLAVEDTGEANLPVTTVMYFTNLSEFPESENYAEISTVTGAAIRGVGAHTRWDNGLIIIEPNTELEKKGYRFDKAYYPSDANNSQILEISTVEDILKNWGSSITIPQKIKYDITSKKIILL